MRKALAVFIVVAVLLTSMVCNLTSNPAEKAKESVSQPQPNQPADTAAFPPQADLPDDSHPTVPDLSALTQENIDWLSELLSEDEIISEYYEQDDEEDGIIDELVYTFESEKIEDHVWILPDLVYRPVGPDEVERLMRLNFYNFNPEARHINYVYEIPKEFAKHVDELEFPIPPAEIIQPDPIIRIVVDLGGYIQSNRLPGFHTVAYQPSVRMVRQDDHYREFYEIVAKIHRQENIVDAKEALHAEAYQLAYHVCQSLTGKDRNSCFLNLAVDFGRNNDQFLGICDEIQDTTRLFCRGVVLGKQACDDASEAGQREVCYAYWIGLTCGDLPKADQPFCIIKFAMENKAPLACMNMSEDDHINYCLAGVSKDPDWCKRIINTTIHKACEDNFGKPNPPPATRPAELVATPTNTQPAIAIPTETPAPVSEIDLIQAAYLKGEDCDQFLSAFPNMFVWNAAVNINPDGYGYETNATLACDFDNDLDLNDPAYRAARVSIVVYFTQEQASEYYRIHYGPDSEMYARTQKNIKSGTPIAYDTLGEWYFFSLKITEGRHNNEGRTRWKNAVIFYEQTRADSNSEGTWDQVVAIAQSLLQSRASP